eukprot:TRINITY_DN100560_c0_g1_i1.p1 TRINITY_DN100560_c0_g1~~TRINITY_DN100560_c0_g1_i1.p1  ORF type:complete len:614 (-),score=117.97 TRINITY_DN100560_c0_g1_i1:143-1984(-)
MAMTSMRDRERESSESDDSTSAAGEVDEPMVTLERAELMRGHRPVVASDVPVYIALKDRDGRRFEAKWNTPNIRYRWSRGPVIKPCVFHPHKMSQIRDVAKTYQCYCSRECFLRGWHNLPRHMWGAATDKDLEPPLVEWQTVATTRNYSPQMDDIDRPLKLEIIPLLKDGRDAPKGGMSVTAGTVIPTPKEARMRRMVSNGGTFNAEWLNKQFKVMNWNVLADLYATESVYPYCEKWALSWNWRKHLILKELKSMTADIITLQEVQKDAFDDWFKPLLAEADYEGIFQQKKREPIFHRGKYTSEGCATFYKTSRFKRVDKLVIDYDKTSQQEVEKFAQMGVSERALQRLSKGNVALAVILEDQVIKATNHTQAAGPTGGRALCVINTHILCDPGAADVKLWQAYLLVKTLKTIRSADMPFLICGDFNSTPDSAVYEFMSQGNVQPNHEDLTKDTCGLFKHLELSHAFGLSSSYQACTQEEAQYTNYTEDFKGTLDYIWFSHENLAVLAISQVDEESSLAQETALPSSTRPSDHVSLVATFLFRETSKEPERPSGRSGHAQSNQGRSMPAGLASVGASAGAGYAHVAGGHNVATQWLAGNDVYTQQMLYSQYMS